MIEMMIRKILGNFREGQSRWEKLVYLCGKKKWGNERSGLHFADFVSLPPENPKVGISLQTMSMETKQNLNSSPSFFSKSVMPSSLSRWQSRFQRIIRSDIYAYHFLFYTPYILVKRYFLQYPILAFPLPS